MDIYKELDKLYENWNFCHYTENLSEYDSKIVFFVDGMLGLTTYDRSLSEKCGKKILGIIKDIYNKKVFEKIIDSEYYYEYIIYCNFIINWLEWGTSIRNAWFDGEFEPEYSLINIGYSDTSFRIDNHFIDELIRWLDN